VTASIGQYKEKRTDPFLGPREDPKIRPDGSTGENTYTTPDQFETREEAIDKLDPYKEVEGVRPVTIPKDVPVQRGVTQGGESPMFEGTTGGASETLIPEGLPPGSVGEFEALP
jgi:hypothetical protein